VRSLRRTLTLALATVALAGATGVLAAGGSFRAALAAAALAGAAAGIARRPVLARIAAPAEEVRLLAESLAAGRLDHRLPTHWADELGDIADALNRMADALARRLDESRSERARLEAVIDAMEEGVLVVGRDGHVLLANPRLRELFSTPAELEGRSLLEAVRQAEVVEALEQALLEGDSQVLEVATGPPPERFLRFSVAPFPSRDGRAGAVAVFRDITELRQIERVRRDFVANASHELKTPLTAIRGFAERLADAELPDASAKHAVEAILGNSRRLGTLVEDLLELSRIESGGVPLRPEPIAVGELGERLLRELDPRLRTGEITAGVSVEGAGRVLADRRALEQVLANLLDNAIKYTPAGGRIEVRVGPAGPGRLRVEVEDTGQGIPRKDLPRIFERFYRVDPGRSRALGGTGLGLAIVKHQVQAMGGQVGVESQLGHGSRFWFDLPVPA
jgi:two-component system phosphate regulon sensor histidine kinase PhoR